MDVTTGDIITPREIEYTFPLLFDERSISILVYNLETILAEKLETVLSRNIANTRPRDFYDIFILYTLRGSECKQGTMKKALEETARKRGSLHILPQYKNIIDSIQSNPTMRSFWARYQKEFDYAYDITFDDTCNVILEIMCTIMSFQL